MILTWLGFTEDELASRCVIGSAGNSYLINVLLFRANLLSNPNCGISIMRETMGLRMSLYR